MPSIQYRMTNGIAVPRDLYTLGSFQGLQAAINSWLVGGYGTLIKVDGEIGPGTLAAARQAIAYLNDGGENIPPPSSVPALAERSRTYATEILVPMDRTPNFKPDPSSSQRSLPGTVVPNQPGPPPEPSPTPAGGKWPWVVGGVLLLGAVIYTKSGRHGDPRGDY